MRAILVSVAMLVTVTSLSAQATQEQVTFTKNVASIIQERCQVCLAAAIQRGIQVVKRGEPYLIDAVTGSR
jgi:hypothetical protein